MNDTVTPQQRLEELQHGVDQARQDVESLSGELHAVEARLKELAAHNDQANSRIHELIRQIQQELNDTEGEIHSSIQELIQESGQLVHGYEHEVEQATNLVRHLVGSLRELGQGTEHSLEQLQTDTHTLVDRSSQSAQKSMGLAQELQQEVGETIQVIVNQAGRDMQAAQTSGQQLIQTVQQQLDQAHQARFSQTLQTTTTNLQQHMTNFGSNIDQHGQGFGDQTTTMLTQFASNQSAEFQQMLSQGQQIAQDVMGVVDVITSLGHDGIQATGTVVEGMQSVNVGLNVTIGTLRNIKDILDEISL